MFTNMDARLKSNDDTEYEEELDIQEFIENECKCPICNEIFQVPITLLCQHTFCRNCLVKNREAEALQALQSSMNIQPSHELNEQILQKFPGKCPICKTRYFIPLKTQHNFILKRLIDEFYPKQDQKEFLRVTLEDEVREELRQELLNTVIDNLQLPQLQLSQPSSLLNFFNNTM